MVESKKYDRNFARLYDLLVYGREEAEADDIELCFLKWVFHELCQRKVKEILDIGCGTGRYLIPLAREGYKSTGLDNSAGMIDECSYRLRRQRLNADLIQKDLTDIDFGGKFDAILCMNSVICYLLDTEKILDALRRFQRALRPKGILVLDNWNFFAQWDRFGRTYSDMRGNDRIRIEYQDRHWYDDFSSIYHIEIIANVHDGKKATYRVYREEVLRAMTVGEMEIYLKDAGFAQVSAYPDFDRSNVNHISGKRMIFLAR